MTPVASRPGAAAAGRRITTVIGALAGAISLAAVVLTFAAPPDVAMGNLTRILPVHVGAAWLAYLSFFVTAAYSLAYLITRSLKLDRIAAVSAEVGLVFIVFALYSGSLWGRPTWGTYWVWDPKLTTTALLFAVYLGYLMVRGAIEDTARRARVSSAIGVVASVGVPINYMSVIWWRSIHQPPTFNPTTGRSSMDNDMLLMALILMVVGFSLMYLFLMRFRGDIARRQAMNEEREIEMAAGLRPSGVHS